MAGRIRIGVGGWVFEPWRGVFYPDGLPQKRELAYMAERVSCIEINATYYGSQKPETWKKWAAETPEGFQFAVKGSRFCTNRKDLAQAAGSLDIFFGQGVLEMGEKLGPILWQFANTKQYDEADFEKFLNLIPRRKGGLTLRHALEVRHDSFICEDFIAQARRHEVAVVFADHGVYPAIADVTGDFIYARLQTGSDDIETAYDDADLDLWAGRLKTWAAGGDAADLPHAAPKAKPKKTPRDVFAFIIHEGKVRAPAGAMALMERVDV